MGKDLYLSINIPLLVILIFAIDFWHSAHLVLANSSERSFNEKNLPEGSVFFCGLKNGEVPTTLAIGNDGKEYPIIRWISTFESKEGRNPQERCKVVSSNFQRAYDRGILKYLRGGRARNGLSTVCSASKQGGACEEILFSLPPGTSANQIVKQLWELSEGTSGPLYQTGYLYYLDIKDLVPLTSTNSHKIK